MPATAQQVDDYDYWKSRLAGEEIAEHPTEPQPGRYRMPASRINRADGRVPRSMPVAIWRENDKLHVMKGRDILVESKEDKWHGFVCEQWVRCVPVSAEDYDKAVAGDPWPDEHEAVSRSNMGPDDESLEGLRDMIEKLAIEAEWLIGDGAAKTQPEADRAADLANRLGQLRKKADEAREAEKKPHLQASRDVDAKWKPVITAAEIYTRLKAAVLTPFLRAKDAEEQKKREEAAKQGEPMPEPQRGASTTVAGSRGRPVSMVTVKRAKINDYDKALLYFKESPKVKELIQSLADAAAKSGIVADGCEIVEEKVAR